MKSSNMSARNVVSGSTEFPWKWKLEDLKQRPKHGHTVLSCFSCGGGSSMGYKLAGFDVIGNCEIDPDMMKVYKTNHHPRYSFLMDIRDFVKLPDHEIPEELFHLDVLDGSPPCSVFSTAGVREEGWNTEKVFREGQAKQRLDDLFLYFIAIAKRLQPKVVIAENVKGIIIGNAKGWVNQIVKGFDDAGYAVQIFLFNAARMGVPQKRERVFFIAHRKDLKYPKLSMEFHSKPIPFGDVREPYGKPMDPDSMQAKLLKYRIPTDRCIADINERVRKVKNNGFSTPINRDEEPVQTIVSGSSLYRMCDGLLMTDKDIISCQTFPQDYDFMGQSVQYICGMSVPPVMMAKIAESSEQFLKFDMYRDTKALLGKQNVSSAVGFAAVTMVERLNASCIVTPTMSGQTARVISNLRPSVPIYGVTPNERTRRKMQLYWGVKPITGYEEDSTENIISHAMYMVVREGLVHKGEMVIFTAGDPATNEVSGQGYMTNMLQVIQAK